MDLLKRFLPRTLRSQFALLGFLCLVAILLPTILYWNEVRQDTDMTRLEDRGLPPSRLLLTVIQRTQQHRGFTAHALDDPAVPKQLRRQKAEDLETAIVAYENYLKLQGTPELRKNFDTLVDYWHVLHQKIASHAIDTTGSFDEHTALVRMELDHLQLVMNHYQLVLDPEGDSDFLIAASLMSLPEITEVLAQIRDLGVEVLSRGNITEVDRNRLSSLVLYSKNRMMQLEKDVAKVVLVGDHKHDELAQKYRVVQAQYQLTMDSVDKKILAHDAFGNSPDTFFDEMTLGIDSYYHYATYAISQLHDTFLARLHRDQTHMYAVLLYVYCTTMVVALVCVAFIRRLLRRLGGEPSYATEIVQAITRGDLSDSIETRDEESLLANMKIMQQKLKENDRLKNEFISTVSHELRTPLTSISGALSVAVSGKLGELPTAAHKMLEIAHANSLRLTELINDLLDIDKLSVGKLVLDLKIQPLMPIIDEACTAMTSYAHKYGVHLEMGPRYEYVLVNVDARRLQQVLMNFLSNAAKFSHKGDDIYVNLKVHGDRVRIEVVDQGVGIPEEFQPRIFQKFSQADSSSTRAMGGTGLGLAISKELIERMNGKIGFTSAEKAGSCFYVELPLEEPNSD